MAKDKGYIRRPTGKPQVEVPARQGVEREADDPFHIHIPTDEEVVSKAKGFWDHFGKIIMIAGGVVIAAILGYFAYNKFYKEPREEKAAEQIFPAESLFDKMASTSFGKDSVTILLNGGEYDGKNITGLLKVISNFGGSDAANRANYMVGASYLHIKEFDKAIKYLKEFKSNGAYQIESKAYVMLGHAYAEKKQVSEALDYYKKAAKVNTKDPVITADALSLAADYAAFNGKKDDAISLYKQLRSDYPENSHVRSGEVEKNLAKLGVLE